MLPFAEGALTNHSPVAKDEVNMIPETTRTGLLASVTAYTLGQIRLSDNGYCVGGYGGLTSSSGIQGRELR